MTEIESLRAGGSPHSVRCPAGTNTRQATLTGVFETTLRKADKGSAVFGEFDDRGIDAIEFRLELSNGHAVITEFLPSGTITGFDQGYSIFKDVIKFDGGASDPALAARWDLDGDRLRFTDVDGPPGDKFVWGRTWIKTN